MLYLVSAPGMDSEPAQREEDKATPTMTMMMRMIMMRMILTTEPYQAFDIMRTAVDGQYFNPVIIRLPSCWESKLC